MKVLILSYCTVCMTAVICLIWRGWTSGALSVLLPVGFSFLMFGLVWFARSASSQLVPAARQALQERAARAAALRRIDPLHLQLMLMERDFNSNDYERLLRLDESVQKFEGLHDSDFRRLPTYQLKESHIAELKGSLKCSICLEKLAVGDEVRVIPCLHKLHKSCLDPWLKTKAECPVCKFPAIS